MEKKEKLIKPAQFVEHEIIKAIISGDWASGEKLLPERELADLLGVTRPTLREVLQRLSRDGWITIKHGKPTIVNDYQNDGGLGVLKTLSNFDEFASDSLIIDWLEFRILILPNLAYKAAIFNSNEIIDKLNNAPDMNSGNIEFAIFDWELQMLLIRKSKNIIAKMLYNDLSEIYKRKGKTYFVEKQIRKQSFEYYNKLKDAILYDKTKIESVVKSTMQASLDIWSKHFK
ncbi:MAG: GntR family transcriptional regulator [Bacteroidales bacterium]|nr:GntR family transcriptional regulator [Bacteroidales bacterium]